MACSNSLVNIMGAFDEVALISVREKVKKYITRKQRTLTIRLLPENCINFILSGDRTHFNRLEVDV